MYLIKITMSQVSSTMNNSKYIRTISATMTCIVLPLLLLSFICSISRLSFSSSPGKYCMVCTITANIGQHYGIICCKGCKCFIKRALRLQRDYKCPFTGNCDISRTTQYPKRICKGCRYKKCKESGMNCESAVMYICRCNFF